MPPTTDSELQHRQPGMQIELHFAGAESSRPASNGLTSKRIVDSSLNRKLRRPQTWKGNRRRLHPSLVLKDVPYHNGLRSMQCPKKAYLSIAPYSPTRRNLMLNVGALIITIHFWGPLYTIVIIRNPQNSIGNY